MNPTTQQAATAAGPYTNMAQPDTWNMGLGPGSAGPPPARLVVEQNGSVEPCPSGTLTLIAAHCNGRRTSVATLQGLLRALVAINQPYGMARVFLPSWFPASRHQGFRELLPDRYLDVVSGLGVKDLSTFVDALPLPRRGGAPPKERHLLVLYALLGEPFAVPDAAAILELCSLARESGTDVYMVLTQEAGFNMLQYERVFLLDGTVTVGGPMGYMVNMPWQSPPLPSYAPRAWLCHRHPTYAPPDKRISMIALPSDDVYTLSTQEQSSS